MLHAILIVLFWGGEEGLDEKLENDSVPFHSFFKFQRRMLKGRLSKPLLAGPDYYEHQAENDKLKIREINQTL